jgi:dienelactone hydrolase
MAEEFDQPSRYPMSALKELISHRSSSRLMVIIFTLVGLSCGGRMPPETFVADSTPRIFFQSVNLTAAQFVAGSKEGPTVTIFGDLVFPPGRAMVPAVVLFPGSAGITGAERGWASYLPRIGVATFLVDSFTPRGISGAPPEEKLSRAGQVIDAYRALELLATHPRIHRNRIVLMGFSRGGGQTIMASVRSFRLSYLPPWLDFAAYIAFYPTLRPTANLIATEVPDRPVRIFHGTLDDSEPIVTVRDYVERVRRAGADVELFEYARARHAFDDPTLTKTIRTSRGFTVGYDAGAHRQAMEKVEDILVSIFRLER